MNAIIDCRMSFYWQSAVQQQQPQTVQQSQDEAYWSSINLGGATHYPWQQQQPPQHVVPQQPIFQQLPQPVNNSNPYEPEPVIPLTNRPDKNLV